MSENRWTAIILAAGKGTRMNSPLAKVLHPVAGVPMVQRVVQMARTAGVGEVRLVVGHSQNLVRQVVEPLSVQCFNQAQQLGTADAVRSAQPETIVGDIVILNGDHPLIEAENLRRYYREFIEMKSDLAVVTAKLKNPGNYGRIVRQRDQIRAIVEARDASQDTLKIREVNTGIYFVKAAVLNEYLPQVKNFNQQKEFYLTDLISLCIDAGLKVSTILGRPSDITGVNNQEELSRATRIVFRRKAKKLMEAGVIMIDPTSVYVEDEVQMGQGCVIYPNVFIRGKTKLGAFVVVEPNCFISSCDIHDSVQIRMGSHLDQATVKARSLIGPYARLRPETQLGEEVHIGNFVELKKVTMKDRSKANHLTYLGDAEIGSDTNIGCGTITCNYAVDRKKYVTKIGNQVFVGSDSQLIAPVEVGDGAVIGSGSTITKNVPAGALAVTRSPQIVKENYKPKKKD